MIFEIFIFVLGFSDSESFSDNDSLSSSGSQRRFGIRGLPKTNRNLPMMQSSLTDQVLLSLFSFLFLFPLLFLFLYLFICFVFPFPYLFLCFAFLFLFLFVKFHYDTRGREAQKKLIMPDPFILKALKALFPHLPIKF